MSSLAKNHRQMPDTGFFRCHSTAQAGEEAHLNEAQSKWLRLKKARVARD